MKKVEISDKKKQERKRELAEIRAGLKHKDEKIVSKAIKQMERKGDASLLPDLFRMLKNTESVKNRKEAINLLNSLKSSAAMPYLIDELKGLEKGNDLIPVILSAIWQANLPIREHITAIAALMEKADYVSAVEIFSIFDNADLSDVQDKLRQTIELVRAASGDDQQLNTLISEIIALLESKITS